MSYDEDEEVISDSAFNPNDDGELDDDSFDEPLDEPADELKFDEEEPETEAV
ncbi:MAG: hypothetical protein WCI93_01465 [bacterium]